MSNMLETLKDMLEDELCNRDLDVYSCELNDEMFTGNVRANLDIDGDLKIVLEMTEEELCDYISPDVMKKYLVDEGHLEEDNL